MYDTLPFIEKVKIRAEVLIPLVRKLQSELGQEKANALVRDGLAEWAQGLERAIAAQGNGTSVEKLTAATSLFTAGGALDVEVHTQTKERLELDVTGCRYAQFFQEMGAPELGFLLVCYQDFPMTEAVGPDLVLERTQTIMEGASHCDFRWSLKSSVTKEE